jgi:hypothetical protein
MTERVGPVIRPTVMSPVLAMEVAVVASRICQRRATRARAITLPDDRLVVASALTALAVLLMMLFAGAA